MLPSEMMIWQPEFRDKKFSWKLGTVQLLSSLSLPFNPIDVITDAVKTFPHPDSHGYRPFVFCPGLVGCRKRLHARHLLTGARGLRRVACIVTVLSGLSVWIFNFVSLREPCHG
ncbi:hypothetical protein EIT02_23970 [Salmonella enterica]|nr:hypothetical protein [Salmonella enterica]EBP3841573.1 hypothetical protein [Salmonella enterica subsp. enterica]ECU4745534.1 hypothetical protein [Salmonella enterica subsp. enterica serovar Berta]EDY1091086.1 hypothetical protein [Salmonella enterica subsp. enterica serovar Sandiego]EAQ3859623.1 hypothetical protein [Salmonella enterica]